MKSILLSIVAAVAFVQLAQAEDVTVKITKVHMCCDSCVKGVAKATEGIDGLKATATFSVPYVSWGMKNPTTLFLKVNDSVDVTIHAAGHLSMPMP